MVASFDFENAFSRNVGWVTERELLVLREKKIAIGGMGGVGGIHLLTLIRMGVGNFHIADFDCFELANFNRQAGASLSSIDRSKTEVLQEMALDINPQAQIKQFGKIDETNINEFLSGVDLYIDGIDFFAVDARELIFTECHRHGIPAITAAPIGMGTSYLIFDQKSMSFEDYFQWQGRSVEEKLIHFMIGLTPNPFHLRYLVDKSRINFKEKKAPSTIMSCNLCAGVAGIEALKILLGRGKIYRAPYCNQFDAYEHKFKHSYILMGNKNPWQKLKASIVKRILRKSNQIPTIKKLDLDGNIIKMVLEEAKWAPSGGNMQPWRFKILSEDEFDILIVSDLKEDFYDFDGKPILLSIGCLIESIRLAANQYGKSIEWHLVEDSKSPRIRVKLANASQNHDSSGLAKFIRARSVCRNEYAKTQIKEEIKCSLQSQLDPGFLLNFHESPREKNNIIKMNGFSTSIRMVLKSCYKTHMHIIQWKDNDAVYGVPYTAVGLNRLTAKIFKIIYPRWPLIHFILRYLGGHKTSSFKTDYLPGKNAAGFFSIQAEKTIDEMKAEELVVAGMQIQRTWLGLTQKGLVMQPCLMPIALSYRFRNNQFVSTDKWVIRKLAKLPEYFSATGFNGKTIMIARYGYPASAQREARSIRMSLTDLILE